MQYDDVESNDASLQVTFSVFHHISQHAVISQQSWLSGRAQNSQAVDQGSRLKQLLIAIRLTKLVAPPKGYSITRLY